MDLHESDTTPARVVPQDRLIAAFVWLAFAAAAIYGAANELGKAWAGR